MQDELLVYKNGNQEFKIKIGTSDKPYTYQVIPMYDASAPDGFQKLRTTKIIDPNVYNRVRLGTFDGDKGMYDAGLTKNSKILTNLYPDESLRQTALKNITKYIVNPLLEIYNKEQILDFKNFDFWDELAENIELDNSYNTSDPIQLFKLYCLISKGDLCPAGLESESYYIGSAQYAVENKDSVIDVGQKRKLEISQATTKFITLLDTDKEGLTAILEWMGITGVVDSEDALLNDIFTNWLAKDDNQNPKAFLETYKQYYESNSGKKELVMFKDLKHLQREKKVIKGMQGFTLNDHFLGKDLKDATKNVLKDDKLLELVYAALG